MLVTRFAKVVNPCNDDEIDIVLLQSRHSLCVLVATLADDDKIRICTSGCSTIPVLSVNTAS